MGELVSLSMSDICGSVSSSRDKSDENGESSRASRSSLLTLEAVIILVRAAVAAAGDDLDAMRGWLISRLRFGVSLTLVCV